MATLKIDGFSKKEIEQSRKIIEDGDRFECENVVAADFMNRGMVDLMVMGSVYKKATGIFGREEKIKDLVVARIFRQINHKGRAAMSTKSTEGEVAFKEQGDIVGMFRGAQPMVLDFNGNRQLDLLGKKYMSENEMDNLEQDQAAQKRQKESGSSVFYSTATSTGDGTGFIHEYIEGETKFCELAQPHFSSVVDLNGDCVPDIFLHCVDNTFELWLNDGKSNFTLYSRNKISLSNSNDEIGQISFADINADGSLDMVYPVCNDKECRLEIVYNNQLPLCKNSYSGFSKECRTLAQVCMQNNKFSFDFEKVSLVV
ncbi:T-cell immunomodulatory protein-like protein [Zancudomyces culisetae]|uniref:T-cell immunomodulatory protein-like protein n=1 Tax=Zancudomyces culisetae TaxID=1213189 RepID=A0A1R1PSX9_ZANCU|nr:T-cell immunomodulatory protein-like protein [Zancudomyces culisetae]|eukprot:OMH84068.1 T-cell immunomodulatory protein-like protein [Zancudomyces culisetae]